MVLANTILICVKNKYFVPQLVTGMRKKLSSRKLIEIGRFDSTKQVTSYNAGQMFLHRVLGYRGLILFPWITRVYSAEFDKSKNVSSTEQTNQTTNNHKQIFYYQVLIDSRDLPFTRILNEPTPILRLEKGFHAIPGVDYASHDDILPYSVTKKDKFQNQLLELFFQYHPDSDKCYEAKEELRSWQEKHASRLELTSVYTEITDNIKATVMPFFVGLRKTRRFVIFLWRYTVRLENLGSVAVKVRKHNWIIFGLSGPSRIKTGSGIAGMEPILNKSAPAFQYSSHVTLHSPCGHMWGMLEMEREDGNSFQCQIPQFILQSDEKC